MKLSEKIIYLRKEKCWSQEQLAIKLEVSRQAVYKWEADINQPDLEKLKRIANLFNVSYDILMDDSIELPLTPNIVEVIEESPEVEVIERVTPTPIEAKTVHNEVAVQINYGKEAPKSPNKKLIATLCVLASVVVVCLCVLSYILFGIVLQKDSYLVKFDTQGGTTVSDQVVKDGNEINNFASPTKAGYTFDGWYLGEKKWNFDDDTVKGNTTLTARWIPNRNTITYINNETGEKQESFANTDETVTLASNTFTKDGYTFLGWATTPNGEVVYSNCASYKMGTENVTLYAIWSSETYNLVLNVGSGTLSTAVPSTFTSSDSIVLPVPVLEFYSFDGWYDSNNNKVEIISKGTTNDMILTARYTPITYSITYVLNGGASNSENPTTYNASQIVTFLSPERQDYSFNGWYLDEDFTKPISKTTLGEGGDLTLYASWDLSIFSFELVSDGYSLIGYTGSGSIVNIPKEYNGVTVVEIAENAFYENESITEINIPYTVTSIDVTAFEGCASLTDINVEQSNSEYCSDNGILYNKQKTVIHKYPMGKEDTIYVAPNSLDVINPYAFAYAIYLEEVYLPNDETLEYGVGKICLGAFEGCISLITIELGYIVNYFEANCFANCWSLESIEFKTEEIWGIERNAFENCFLLTDVIFNSTSVKEISNNVFLGCLSLSAIDLTTVEKLGTNVFEMTGLKNVFIPSTLTSIGSNLFVDCEELIVYCEATSKPDGWAEDWSTGATEVIWGQGGQKIENELIYEEFSTYITITGCVGEGSIIIPSTINGKYVNYIGPNAFSGQTKITEISIPGSVASIDTTAFDNCPSLEKIIFNDQSNKYYGTIDGVLYCDYNKQLLKYPEGKKDEVFSIPYHVDIVRSYAFKSNPYLKKVILPSDVTGDNYVGKLERGAFEGCVSLTEVEGCYANYLERDVFRDCSSLKEIIFYANDVWGIGNYSFLNCYSLESVTFKGNMHEIGYQVFGYCSKLSNVTFNGTLGKLSMHIFENCTSLTSITLPEGPTAMVSEAFKGCFNLTSINIPSTVTLIEDYAFLGTGIKEILIPVTVTDIEKYAFLGLADLTIYCEALEKPSGWSDKWNYADEKVVLDTRWGQDGPNDIEFTFVQNADNTLTLTNCTGSGSAVIPEKHNGMTVTAIGEKAFHSKSDITLIRIPKTVTTIATNAFNLCYDLESIVVDSENSTFSSDNDILYNKSKTTLIRYPMNKTANNLIVPSTINLVEDYAFYGSLGLTSITFEGDISKIGLEAFNSCANIEAISFQGKLGELGEKSFYFCAHLKSITLPEGLTVLPAYVFSNCYKLEEFNIPSSVSTIKEYAFEATGLKEIFIPSTITVIEKNAFSSSESLMLYCEALEKPDGWNDKWNYSSEETILDTKWAQSGLPSN